MEWNMKTNPTFKDISANRSPYFLTVRRHSAFVAKDYYNSKLDKWFKNSDCVEEVPVAAWMPLPKFYYDTINRESELIKSADGESMNNQGRSGMSWESMRSMAEGFYDMKSMAGVFCDCKNEFLEQPELNNRKSSSLIDYMVDLITKTDPISPYIVVQDFSPDFEVGAEVKDKVGDFSFKYI